MVQEADLGLTEYAFDNEHSRNRFKGDENLVVMFYMHPRIDREKSKEEGRPIYNDTPYVQIMQPGNKENIVQRPASDLDKTRFASQWKAFEEKRDVEITGTLLEEWGILTPSQIVELRYFNIRTVEQLAHMSDANAQNFGAIGALRNRAKEYLEVTDGQAISGILEEMEALKARIAELEEEEDES